MAKKGLDELVSQIRSQKILIVRSQMAGSRNVKAEDELKRLNRQMSERLTQRMAAARG